MAKSHTELDLQAGAIHAFAQMLTEMVKRPSIVRDALVGSTDIPRDQHDDNCQAYGYSARECETDWQELQDTIAKLKTVRVNSTHPFKVYAGGPTSQPHYEMMLRRFLPEPGQHAGYQLLLYGLPAAVTERRGSGPRYSSKHPSWDPLYPWPTPIFMARNGYLTVWGDGALPYKHVRQNPRAYGGVELTVGQWVALSEFLAATGNGLHAVPNEDWVDLMHWDDYYGHADILQINLNKGNEVFYLVPSISVDEFVLEQLDDGNPVPAYQPRQREWTVVWAE